MDKLAFRFSEKEFGWPIWTSCPSARGAWGRAFYCCPFRASGCWMGGRVYSAFLFVTVLCTFRPSSLISVKKMWLHLSSAGVLGGRPLFLGVSASKPSSWGFWGPFEEVASPLRFEDDMPHLFSNRDNSSIPIPYEVGAVSVKSQPTSCCMFSSVLSIFLYTLAVNCGKGIVDSRFDKIRLPLDDLGCIWNCSLLSFL
jgi:hypothetical protein